MTFHSDKKTILIVDDDETYVQKVKDLLSPRYLTFAAYDGEQALKMLQTIKPDLILLDIGMPKMDGLELFDRITPLNSRPLYPVLVVTVRENLREFFKSLPVEGFVSKPFKGADLLETIAKIFEKAASPAPASTVHFQKILIVEQNMETVGKLAYSFLDRGHTVTAVKNAQAAIERIVGTEFPNMILIRQGLADHPEYTIPYHLRGIQSARDVKTVVYTESYRNVDLQTEAEIAKAVGEKNFLEIGNLEQFLEKLFWILDKPK